MAAALEGIRVIDLTVWFQGPVAAQHLADFGAEVIHVERPKSGDQARGVKSIAAVPVADWNQYFLCVNRNKKSLAVDLKSAGGRELMHRLVEQCDVFLWNQGLDSLPGLGLDWATLSKRNPRLIHATNSGYGHAGSFTKPSFDMTVQALTGIMARQGEPGEPPIYLGLGAGDAYGGLMSALGIVLALHARRRTGVGQALDASLYGAQLYLGAPQLQAYLAGNEDRALQHSRRAAPNPLWNRYPTRGKWVYVCEHNEDARFALLAEAFGDAALANDPRFADADRRANNNTALIDALDALAGALDHEALLAALELRGLACAPVNTLADVIRDEQAWDNDYLMKAWCEEVRREVEVRGLPVTLSKTPGQIDSLGPQLGQDTELLMMDLLGYEWDQIEALKAQGAIP